MTPKDGGISSTLAVGVSYLLPTVVSAVLPVIIVTLAGVSSDRGDKFDISLYLLW